MNAYLKNLMMSAIEQKKEIRITHDGLNKMHLQIYLRNIFSTRYVRLFVEICPRSDYDFDVIAKTEYYENGTWSQSCNNFFASCSIGKVDSVNYGWNNRCVVSETDLTNVVAWAENRAKSANATSFNDIVSFNE